MNETPKFPTVAELRKIVAKSPTYENLINLGSGLRRANRLDEAGEILKRCLAMDPTEPAAWSNAAQLYSDLGRFEQAPGLFQRALQCHEKKGVHPTMAQDTLLGFAYSLMRLGQFQYVWPAWEAARLQRSWYPFPNMAPWRGEEVKRLLVLPEGGYGDGFCFARWFPLLAARVPEVLFIVWDRLYEYARHVLSPWGIKVFPMSHQFRYAEIADITHCTPLMSLPTIPGMQSWNDIPPQIDWTPPAQIVHPPLDQIGFCWLAEENGSQKCIRSLPIAVADQIGRVLSRRCEKVVSLCLPGKNLKVEESHFRPPRGVAQDPTAIDGWEQTARTILKCRFVVTVDTAVGHLAGSLGVPTLMLLPLRSSWQWSLPGGDLPPWYKPTFKAYRETNPVGWTPDAILKVLESY
jgi:Tetratricopeptide repeat